MHIQIDDVYRVAEKQINLSEDAGKTEFVLILDIGSVAPFEHKHLDGVGTLVQVLVDKKFACHVTDLAVPDKTVVDEKIEAGVHTLKVQINGLFQHFFRHREVADIKPAGIVVRHVGRIQRKGHIHIGVVGCVIAAAEQGLPGTRNVDLIHAGAGECFRQKVFDVQK